MTPISRKSTLFSLSSCVVAAALFGSVTANAQEVSRPLQLSFGANLLSYESTKISIAGDSATATNTELGPEGAGFSVGVGLRPAQAWLVGLSLHGSRARATDGRDGTPGVNRSAYAVMPRLEYWFAPADAISPYVGATLGLRGSSASAGPGTKSSANDFAIGGVAGIRAFAAPGFSIDPNVALLAFSGSGEGGGASLDRSGFAFVLGISLSGWLETDPPATVAAVRVQTPTPTLASVPPVAPTQIESALWAPAAAEDPPPLVVNRDADGTLRSEIWLSDGRRLRVMGRPNQEASSVLVTLLNGTAPSIHTRPCTALNIVIDGRPHSIVPGPRPVAGSAAVQVLMTPAALLAIGEAKQSAQLERCGVSSEIFGAARSLLGDFYREFRSTAERYGRRVPEALAD